MIVDYILNKSDYYVKTLIDLYSVLWWLFPALFIDIAIKSFIWKPTERAFGLVIPKSVQNFITLVIFLLAFFGIIAYVYDRKITSLLATSGMFLMIIGLAIQMNIANIFSGIAMALEQPFKPGDWIKVSNFDEGEVIDISWRTTKVLTIDNNIISFPNSTVSEGQIKNYYSPNTLNRQSISLKIDPKHAPKDVEKILMDACLSTKKVLIDDDPLTRLNQIDEWYAEYKVIYSINDFLDRKNIKQQLWKNIWAHLDYANLQFATHPFQQSKDIASRNMQTDKDLILRVIQHIPLLSVLNQSHQSQIIDGAHIDTFQIGDTLCEEGDNESSLLILLEGATRITQHREGTDVEINRLGAGDIIGEMSLLTGEERNATVTALSYTKILTIKKEDIEPILKSVPELVYTLGDIIAQRQKINKTIQEQLDATNVKIKSTIVSKIIHQIKRWFNIEIV